MLHDNQIERNQLTFAQGEKGANALVIIYGYCKIRFCCKTFELINEKEKECKTNLQYAT